MPRGAGTGLAYPGIAAACSFQVLPFQCSISVRSAFRYQREPTAQKLRDDSAALAGPGRPSPRHGWPIHCGKW